MDMGARSFRGSFDAVLFSVLLFRWPHWLDWPDAESDARAESTYEAGARGLCFVYGLFVGRRLFSCFNGPPGTRGKRSTAFVPCLFIALFVQTWTGLPLRLCSSASELRAVTANVLKMARLVLR